MPRRDPVMLAWVAGLVVAALVYLVGFDNFFVRLEYAFHSFAWRLAEVLAELSVTALDVARALSVGLFVTFLALVVAVSRRGGRSRGAAVVVTVLFLLLVGGASGGDPARWLAALVLSGLGAAVMTARLRHAGTLVRA